MAESESSEVIEACAVAIGDALCRSAIWHDDMCNWFGHCAEEMDDASHAITPTVGSLEADLYGGSSGVGLFLARLATRTQSGEHRRTAIAALRRSLATAERLSPIGLYSGRIGVAHAVALAGAWLRDEALLAEGLALVRRAVGDVLTTPAGEEPIDVVAGLAGSIMALIPLAKLPGGAGLDDAVHALAQRLVARARRGADASWSWHDVDAHEDGAEPQSSPPALSGMSHGASGIGLALLEAHRALGDDALLEAGRAAFAFENTLYRPEANNWLDLREWVVQSSGPDTCSLTWCHGAPGIALARLRASALDPDESRWRDDATIAVDATRDELRRRKADRRLDATLCHGTCGLAETLLVGGHVLGRSDLVDEAIAIARTIAEQAATDELVSGVPSGGKNPSLMLGAAGVGWFCLRAIDPTRTASFLTSPATQEGTP